jgi:predicted dehydrogenase
MSEVRWGLLSTANINKALIPAIRASVRGELVAVSSRSKRDAKAYAKQWKIPNFYGGYQKMLDSGEVDAVYISLPNHLHAEWTIKALKAGVHVLCEKPFAITLEEVDAMIAAKEETGLVLAEAFMYRHHPQTKIAGEMVHSGKLGEISIIRGAFDFAFRSRKNVRLVPEWGGGCLWDVGVYPMSFTQFIMGGPPDWVLGNQWLGDTGVDEVFAGQMGYSTESGLCTAQISSSFRTPYHTFIEIVGTEGRLYLNKPFVGLGKDRSMTFYPKEGGSEEIPVPAKELYIGEVEDMHAAILDGEPNYLKLEETRNHVATVLALYESANTGKVVKLHK